MDCNEKILYECKSDARNALAGYREQVLFSNMVFYYCDKHEGYHLGHNHRLSKKTILKIYRARPKNYYSPNLKNIIKIYKTRPKGGLKCQKLVHI